MPSNSPNKELRLILDGQVLILQSHITLIKELQKMSDVMDTLTQKVAAEGTVINSAVALLNGLSQQLKDALAANDPAAIQTVIDSLDSQTQELATAVTANTPAAPAPVVSDPVPASVDNSVSPSA